MPDFASFALRYTSTSEAASDNFKDKNNKKEALNFFKTPFVKTFKKLLNSFFEFFTC